MAENDAGPVGGPNDAGGPPVDLGKATPAPAAPAAPATPPAAPPATPPAAAAPPVTPPADPAPKTIGDPPKEPEPKPATPADWPDDWRQKLAGDDKKLMARLERMGSVKDILNSWRGLEQRLSSGELRRALPRDPTPEEIAEYRKTNNVPEKAEDYDVNLGNGFVWGEADKPLLTDFTKFAHERNMPGDMVKASLEWFANQQQSILDNLAQRDESERVNGGESLRSEWGGEYTKNLTAARNLFEGKAADLWDTLIRARAEDGSRLGNKPELLKFLSGVSRELNPFATLVPDNGGAAPLKTAEARLSELNIIMKDKAGPYWRGPQAETLQTEWRDLHTSIEKAKGRAA